VRPQNDSSELEKRSCESEIDPVRSENDPVGLEVDADHVGDKLRHQMKYGASIPPSELIL
jgi:hypothetical protein